MRAALATVLLSSSVFAQTIQDDFESGQLPGAWATDGVMFLGDTLNPAQMAKHRGNMGLRIVDGHSSGGIGAEALLDYFPGDLTGDYFARGWLRMTQQNDAGQIFLVQLESPGATDINQIGFDFTGDPVTGGLFTGGFDSQGSYDPYSVGQIPDDGAWHLFECDVLRFGSDAGARQLFWDGVKLDDTPIDLSGLSMDQLNVGEVYGDLVFEGTLDYDDVRTSLVRPATFLVLTGPASAGTGECVPFSVELRDVLGSLAPAPYDVVAALSLSGPSGQFYSDECTTPTITATVPAGQHSGAVWLRAATAGMAVANATHADFLASPPQQVDLHLTAGSGGGAGGGGEVTLAPRALYLACGCSQPGALPLLVLTALRWFRRRPARRR